MGKSIGLDVPKRTLPDKKAFNIRPRKLASWIDALPRANLGETAKQIFTVLHQTNQLSYPYQDRIRFLETLREPLDYVTRSMKNILLASVYLYLKKARKLPALLKNCMQVWLPVTKLL